MGVPDFQSLMLPLLRIARDSKEHSLAEARGLLGAEFNLSQAELEEPLPSGRQSRFANRVAWAKVYLEQGGLLVSPRRGYFAISDRGRKVPQGSSRADRYQVLGAVFRVHRVPETEGSWRRAPDPTSCCRHRHPRGGTRDSPREDDRSSRVGTPDPSQDRFARVLRKASRRAVVEDGLRGLASVCWTGGRKGWRRGRRRRDQRRPARA